MFCTEFLHSLLHTILFWFIFKICKKTAKVNHGTLMTPATMVCNNQRCVLAEMTRMRNAGSRTEHGIYLVSLQSDQLPTQYKLLKYWESTQSRRFHFLYLRSRTMADFVLCKLDSIMLIGMVIPRCCVWHHWHFSGGMAGLPYFLGGVAGIAVWIAG